MSESSHHDEFNVFWQSRGLDPKEWHVSTSLHLPMRTGKAKQVANIEVTITNTITDERYFKKVSSKVIDKIEAERLLVNLTIEIADHIKNRIVGSFTMKSKSRSDLNSD